MGAAPSARRTLFTVSTPAASHPVSTKGPICALAAPCAGSRRSICVGVFARKTETRDLQRRIRRDSDQGGVDVERVKVNVA
ncbi:hypothetical protein NDU88_006733 [Pleurodeles waltl]|uniref:Uncharacterized protein n=1 Tax=Pleurodeles waltl TaxID=8319 RepID=A0AAV7VMR3_PLEWA|nr:hypothetical protein NDU88_006733 [Pleurodeles waltl]